MKGRRYLPSSSSFCWFTQREIGCGSLNRCSVDRKSERERMKKREGREREREIFELSHSTKRERESFRMERTSTREERELEWAGVEVLERNFLSLYLPRYLSLSLSEKKFRERERKKERSWEEAGEEKCRARKNEITRGERQVLWLVQNARERERKKERERVRMEGGFCFAPSQNDEGGGFQISLPTLLIFSSLSLSSAFPPLSLNSSLSLHFCFFLSIDVTFFPSFFLFLGSVYLKYGTDWILSSFRNFFSLCLYFVRNLYPLGKK